MSYYKTYTVKVSKNTDSEEFFYQNLGRAEAIKIAKIKAKDNELVFISTYRRADGQEIYYNKNGYEILGKSWA